MYNNDINRKQTGVNRSFKSLSGDIANPVIKFPVILPPINTEFANNFISRSTRNIVDYKYDPTSNRTNRSFDFISPDILSKYPCLNPMYKFNYRLSDDFLNDVYTDNGIDVDSGGALGGHSDADSGDEVGEEIEFQYEQRNWVKVESNTLSQSSNKPAIILMKGDVVNIDTKTLVFDKFNYKTSRHVFKELTSLKIYDYDLNMRPYTVVIPSQLKYDIIHSPPLRKPTTYYDHVMVDEALAKGEGYLSDLENGTCSPAILGVTPDDASSLVETDILREERVPIIVDYVSSYQTIDRDYNITNTTVPIPPTVDFPRVVGHEDDSYNGTYFISTLYGYVNDWPVFSTGKVGGVQRFIFRYPVKFTKSGFVWVLQPLPPGTPEWSANAYGCGDKDPWLADWGNTTIVNANTRECLKVTESVKPITVDDTSGETSGETDDEKTDDEKTDEAPASYWCVIS